MLMPVVDWKELWGKRGVRVSLISGLAVLGLAGIGTAGYYLWPEPAPAPPPPAETSTFSDNADYLATDDFSRQPMDKRLAWIETRIQRDLDVEDDEMLEAWESMDEATRKRIRDNIRPVMQERARRQARTYAKLRGEERTAYLDERIDEFEQWHPKLHKMFGSPDRRGPDARRDYENMTDEELDALRERRRQRMVQETHKFMTEMSSDDRAKQMSFFTAIGKRRAQRGLVRFFGRGRSSRR
jgi:acyl-homoserine lactone acylase PvdQ